MSSANNSPEQGTPVQNTLSSLLSRHLQRQADAHALGLADIDSAGDVVPYEVGPVQPIDARLAWEEAVAALKFYGPSKPGALQSPPQWHHLVTNHEPSTALAFCVGNFPQLVRDYQTLLHAQDLAKLRPATSQPIDAPALLTWAKQTAAAKQFPQILVALGALRLAKQFELAESLINTNDSSVPAEYQSAWANEKAALGWERGRFDEAASQWASMNPSVPVLFNRGMAALFCGRPSEAQTALTGAVSQLPETSAWYHLGRLYLALLSAA